LGVGLALGLRALGWPPDRRHGPRHRRPQPQRDPQRLILEVDSTWHDGPIAQEDDAARQADLEAAGERVLRTTLEQAILRPHQLVRRLVAAGAPYTDRQP
jgi:Protein of unknown function (DUF559)